MKDLKVWNCFFLNPTGGELQIFTVRFAGLEMLQGRKSQLSCKTVCSCEGGLNFCIRICQKGSNGYKLQIACCTSCTVSLPKTSAGSCFFSSKWRGSPALWGHTFCSALRCGQFLKNVSWFPIFCPRKQRSKVVLTDGDSSHMFVMACFSYNGKDSGWTSEMIQSWSQTGLCPSGINGMMLESLHVEKNMGGLSTHVVNVLSICLQEHWTYVESLGLAKLPGEEPCGVTWSLVN